MNLCKNTWNEDYWGRAQTKSIQGICAIIIILHHMAQKTCAPWLPEGYLVHGLEPFLSVGYLMVGMFFFCSGYGLYLSVKLKDGYLNGFIGNHFRPILLLFVISNACYYLAGNVFSGYNWFIYAILYMYVAFYLSFRRAGKDAVAIGLIVGFIALYVIICEIFCVGTWCYNTIGVFAVGMIFAENRDRIVAFIRRKYIASLITSAAVLVMTFAGAEILSGITAQATELGAYNVLRIITVGLQFIAASAFTVLLFVISQKVVIKGRVPEFIGSMTLELYLIHVMYVEMFGYCFGNAENGAVCYIRSIFLYVPVVLALSLVSAFLLSLIKKGAHRIYVKQNELFLVIRRDCRKFLIGLAIALAGITVIVAVKCLAAGGEQKEKAKQYCDENIRFVNVDGTDIALYIAGDSDRTVLILRGGNDCCATLSKKNLADTLGEKFRAVVIDFPGCGFSGEAVGRRNVENICKDIHGVANELGIRDYILFTEGIAGLYAQYYVNRYPGEVSTVVNLDAETAGLGRAGLATQRLSLPEYIRQNRRNADFNYIISRIVDSLGYKEFIWPIFKQLYTRLIGWQNEEAAYYIYFKSHGCKALRDEQRNLTDTYLAVENLTYPENIAVVDFLSESRRKGYERRGINVSDYLNELSGGCRTHKIVSVADGEYSVYFGPGVYLENIEDILNCE